MRPASPWTSRRSCSTPSRRCTLREVADLTGIKITTVQNHLERGLRRLRDQLGANDDEE
jgi:DNA-directed RNA polymerase specialized sigma24 family protein